MRNSSAHLFVAGKVSPIFRQRLLFCIFQPPGHPRTDDGCAVGSGHIFGTDPRHVLEECCFGYVMSHLYTFQIFGAHDLGSRRFRSVCYAAIRRSPCARPRSSVNASSKIGGEGTLGGRAESQGAQLKTAQQGVNALPPELGELLLITTLHPPN